MPAKHQRHSNEIEEQRRTDAEIIDDMLEVMEPPPSPGTYLECKAELKRCIRCLRYYEQAERLPSPATFKEGLADYLDALHAVKRKFVLVRSCHPGGYDDDTFLEELGDEIARIQRAKDAVKVRPGGRRENRVAAATVEMAAHLIDPSFHNPADPDLERARQLSPVKLTKNGRWHRLAMLLFEAVTGRQEAHSLTWKYMKEFHARRKRGPVPPRLFIGDYD